MKVVSVSWIQRAVLLLFGPLVAGCGTGHCVSVYSSKSAFFFLQVCELCWCSELIWQHPVPKVASWIKYKTVYRVSIADVFLLFIFFSSCRSLLPLGEPSLDLPSLWAFESGESLMDLRLNAVLGRQGREICWTGVDRVNEVCPNSLKGGCFPYVNRKR